MVYGNHGDVALNQFYDFRIREINTCKHHAVKSPIPAVFQIGHPVFSVPAAVDEGDIIAPLLSSTFKTVQHTCKVIMGKTAAGFIFEQHPDSMGSVCLQCSRGQIRRVSHLFCDLLNMQPRLFADVGLIVQRFAHRSHRHPTYL